MCIRDRCLPSRYGFNPDDLRKADAIEVVIGQGAKPGGGGMLLGQKVNPRVAKMRTLPEGVDQRSACRHPDWTGPDDPVSYTHLDVYKRQLCRGDFSRPRTSIKGMPTNQRADRRSKSPLRFRRSRINESKT